LCDKLSVHLVAAGTEEKRTKSKLHHVNSEGHARLLQKIQTKRSEMQVMFFLYVDLQQALFCPILTFLSDSSYNLTIQNANSKDTVISFWHESIVKEAQQK
jgi:hypothetical protein